MQFMVMSTPRPERPSEMRGRQAAYWDWLEPLKQNGTVKAVYVKTGRGLLAVFDVPDHKSLHRYITEWAEQVPAEFMIWPLVDAVHQEQIARKGATKT